MAVETLEQAQRIAKSRVFITKAGKYQVKVTNDTHYLASTGKAYKELSDGSIQASIGNVNAMTAFHLAKFKQHCKEGDFNGATNHSLSFGIRSKDYMPSKGEVIEIIVGEVTTKTGETALLITSYNPLPISAGSKISDAMFADDEESIPAVEVEFTADKKTAKPVAEKAPFEA